MSVFDALGAAAAIIQFIECGIDLSNKTIAIYKGRHQFSDLLSMTQSFEKEDQRFIEDLHLKSKGPDSGEELLIQTAKQCQQTADELTRLISQMSLRQGEKGKIKSLRSAIKTKYGEKDVLGKRDELERLRKSCHEQLTAIMSERQYALADALVRIEGKQASAESVLVRHLLKLKQDVIAAVNSHTLPDSKDLSQKLRTAQRLATLDLPRESILSSLRYSEIDNRQSSILSTSHSTYEWMFEEKETGSRIQYMPWLKSGDGIFWVTGKAGSGKSTLMKHIYNDPRTESAMEHWANGRKLLKASHYFWYLGSSKEKSYQGLIMSILYKVLHACPHLIESVCRSRWQDELRGLSTSSMMWGDDELRGCLDELVTSNLKFEGQDICFCFYIDGLDEYDGDDEVIKTLVRLAQSGHTKICASSRPWNRFEHAFSSSKSDGNYLELHQHTRGDISKFVVDELKDTLCKLPRVDEDWMPLIHEVIDRSEGVFLWVALVIKKELRPMLEARDHVSFVQKRLKAVPSDLNEYFQRIFERICANERYNKDTARIFKSCIAANGPLPIAAVGVITSSTPDRLAISAKIDRSPVWDSVEEIAVTRTQVNGRCQDLLAVVDPPETHSQDGKTNRPLEICRIEFLHRSVRDFLQQSDTIRGKLIKYAEPDFDVDLTLVACYVVLLRKAATFSTSGGPLDISKARQWSTEALLHLRKINHERAPSAMKLLQSLDETMQCIFSAKSQTHWSNKVCAGTINLNSSQPSEFSLAERGNRDLVGHLIEFGLSSYVKAALTGNSKIKQGRPYLDYALRYNLHAAFRSDAQQDHLSRLAGDLSMVEMLLGLGCNVNEPIYIYGGRTVWDLYLAFLFDNQINDERYCKITWLLINNGAKPIKSCVVGKQEQDTTDKYRDVTFRNMRFAMRDILRSAFGEREADEMCERIAENANGSWWTRLTFWK